MFSSTCTVNAAIAVAVEIKIQHELSGLRGSATGPQLAAGLDRAGTIDAS